MQTRLTGGHQKKAQLLEEKGESQFHTFMARFWFSKHLQAKLGRSPLPRHRIDTGKERVQLVPSTLVPDSETSAAGSLIKAASSVGDGQEEEEEEEEEEKDCPHWRGVLVGSVQEPHADTSMSRGLALEASLFGFWLKER